jgi:hypothetical protein
MRVDNNQVERDLHRVKRKQGITSSNHAEC